MSKEIITTENDYVAFFTNDVTDFLTENLSETIKTAINDSILSGNLSPAIPIAVTVNSDTKEITLLNVMLEEVNLNVVPGSVILPSSYGECLGFLNTFKRGRQLSTSFFML